MMRLFNYKRLLVFEPKRPLHEYHRGLFDESGIDADFHVIDSESEILHYISPRSIPLRKKIKKAVDMILVACPSAYFQFMKFHEYVRGHLPECRIVLHDETPRQGCVYLADSLSLHGCCTHQDDRQDVLDCVSRIVEGVPAVAPSVSHLLHVDENNGVLCGKPEQQILGMYELTAREWTCFRHLVTGGTLDDLSEELGLSVTYVTKLKYQMMRKLEAGTFANLVQMAKEWGFI